MSNQIRNTNISIQGKSLAFIKDVGTAYAQRGDSQFEEKSITMIQDQLEDED
jgi:hypothetical protein